MSTFVDATCPSCGWSVVIWDPGDSFSVTCEECNKSFLWEHDPKTTRQNKFKDERDI